MLMQMDFHDKVKYRNKVDIADSFYTRQMETLPDREKR